MLFLIRFSLFLTYALWRFPQIRPIFGVRLPSDTWPPILKYQTIYTFSWSLLWPQYPEISHSNATPDKPNQTILSQFCYFPFQFKTHTPQFYTSTIYSTPFAVSIVSVGYGGWVGSGWYFWCSMWFGGRIGIREGEWDWVWVFKFYLSI